MTINSLIHWHLSPENVFTFTFVNSSLYQFVSSCIGHPVSSLLVQYFIDFVHCPSDL